MPQAINEGPTIKAVETMATETAIKRKSRGERMSLDLASRLFDWSSIALAIGACIVFISTAAIVWFGIVKEHHWDVLRAHANEKIASVGLEAAKANAELGVAQADIAKAHSEIEKSKKETEGLRSANLKLEAQIAPRRLKPEQQDALASALESFAEKSVNFDSYILDVEAAALGEQLAAALGRAKIKSDATSLRKRIPTGSIADGIRISGKDGKLVDALLNALAPTGLKVSRGEAVEAVGGVTTHVSVGGSVPNNPDGRRISPSMAVLAASGMLDAQSTPWDAIIFVGVKPMSQP
jgi:hypothetical protein